nr:hypothetical protein [Lentinula edodes]
MLKVVIPIFHKKSIRKDGGMALPPSTLPCRRALHPKGIAFHPSQPIPPCTLSQPKGIGCRDREKKNKIIENDLVNLLLAILANTTHSPFQLSYMLEFKRKKKIKI